MALTLDQEAALLALLEEKRVTLPELTATAEIKFDDLFLVNQSLADKSVAAKIVKDYISPQASMDVSGIVQLTSSVDNDSEEMAATPKAVKKTYQLANRAYQLADTANTTANEGKASAAAANQLANSAYTLANTKLSRDSNLSDVPNKAAALVNLGIEARLYPVGAPIPWPSTSLPSGYLKCNGATFNKTQYPKLAVAYPSGRLPDLRGEFIRGWDDGRGADSGRSLLSLQGDAMRNITGTFGGNQRPTSGTGAFYLVSNGAQGNKTSWDGAIFGFDASRVVPTAKENRPRNVAFLYIVKAA